MNETCEGCGKSCLSSSKNGDVVLCDLCDATIKVKKLMGSEDHSHDDLATKKPEHYSVFKMDIIDYCQINNLDFMVGNVIKYVMRYKTKNGIDDLKKAMTYLRRIAKHEYNQDLS